MREEVYQKGIHKGGLTRKDMGGAGVSCEGGFCDGKGLAIEGARKVGRVAISKNPSQ